MDTTEVKNIWKANGAKPGMVLYEVYTTVYITPRDGLAEAAETEKVIEKAVQNFARLFSIAANTLHSPFVLQAERRGEAHVGNDVRSVLGQAGALLL